MFIPVYQYRSAHMIKQLQEVSKFCVVVVISVINTV